MPATGIPVIFFTDLESGPNTGGENNNGAFVTIYGKNLSGSTVTVGGGSAIIKLTSTPYLWYEKMAIQLGASTNSGNIIVTNAYGSSNNLPFTVRAGNVYCVSMTGADSNNGKFTTETPPSAGVQGCWLNVYKAKNTIAAGDIAYILDGANQTTPEPGTGVALQISNGGNLGNPKALIVYPGGTSVLGAIGSGDWVGSVGGIKVLGSASNADYITIAGFTFKTFSSALSISGNTYPSAQHWRFIGNYLTCPGGDGQSACASPGSMEYLEFLGNEITDAGCKEGGTQNCKLISPANTITTVGTTLTLSGFTSGVNLGARICVTTCASGQVRHIVAAGPNNLNWILDSAFTSDVTDSTFQFRYGLTSKQYHSVYVDNSDHIEIGWSYIHNNNSCRGILTNSTGTTGGHQQHDLSYHDNIIHHQTCAGIDLNTVDPNTGPVEVYNNLIYHVGTGPTPHDGIGNLACIYSGDNNRSSPGAGTIEVYNNTLYDCGSYNPTSGDSGAINKSGQNENIIINLRNNIILQNSGEVYIKSSGNNNINAQVTGSKNLFAMVSGSAQDLSGFTGLTPYLTLDPLFISTTTPDFHLQSTSPAKDAGVFTTALFDIDGISRPQGASFDIGAYEYPSGAVADTTSPTVSITSPTDGSTLSGAANTITANASDNIGVVGVQFKIDGINLGSEDTSSPYSINWDTTTYTNGSHTITAVARDPSSNTTTSSGVSVNVNNEVAPTPPVISNVTASSITTTGATITWTTDKSSDSQVEYGLTTSYGSSTTLDSTLVTNHSVLLSGLTSQTTYHYRVKSQDTPGNLATSGDFTFTTATPPPVISNVQATNITATSVTITWATDRATTSKVNYGLTSSYTNSTVKDTTLVTSHSVSIGGLSASTLYHYQVESSDSGNLTSVSSDATFTTAASALPVISNIQATNITTSGVTITWTTDISSDSQVEYGTTTAYGSSTTLDSTLVTSHSVALTGLSAGTIYNYRVKSSGAVSTNKTFSTTSASDTTAPAAVTNLASTGTTRTSVDLSWTAPGDDGNTGTATSYDMRWLTVPITDSNWSSANILTGLPAPKTAGTTQTYTAIGLTANITYYFALKTKDESNNVSALSNVISAKTKTDTATGGGGGGASSFDASPGPVKISRIGEADSQILLEWRNPTDEDFVRVQIVVNENRQPLNQDDGRIILEENTTKFLHVNLRNGKTYYFNIYALDLAKNFSEPVKLKAVPQEGVLSFAENIEPLDVAQTTQYIAPKIITEEDFSVFRPRIFPKAVLIRYAFDKNVYYIENGKRRLVPNYATLLKLTNNNPNKVLTVLDKELIDGYSSAAPLEEKDITSLSKEITAQSALVKTKDKPTVYLVNTIDKTKQTIPTLAVFYSYGFSFKNVSETKQEDVDALTEAGELTLKTFPNGFLMKSPDSYKVYIIQDGQKRWIKTLKLFLGFKYIDKDVTTLPKELIEAYPTGSDIEKQDETLPSKLQIKVPATIHADGTLVKLKDNYKVYLVDKTQLKWIETQEEFKTKKYKLKDVIAITKDEFELYGMGEEEPIEEITTGIEMGIIPSSSEGQ